MAFNKAFTSIRSSGIIETRRSTLNTRNKRAINIVEPATGIKLPTTIMTSKTFQPFEKNFLKLFKAIYRIIISAKKKMVMPVSSKAKACSNQGGSSYVCAPPLSADTTITKIIRD